MTREEHQELVAVIRGVHEKLRLEYQTHGDGDQVWRNHCKDVEARSKYAASMLQLATTVWPYKDRIEWCYHTMREYFFGGVLKRSLQRQYRKMGLPCPESILKQAREKIGLTPISPRIPISHTNLLSMLHGARGVHMLQLPNLRTRDLGLSEERVHLLDVGSCYNPFNAYADVDALAIDLTPATEDVIECDFLKLKVVPRGDEELVCSRETPLEALPESSFQAVTFCLVLEYLPSCRQRWSFCRKAALLLKPNGLLFIITPDSKHQQRNAAMIASWRKALEHIGLLRVRYEKRQHLHCMAFRKHLRQMDGIRDSSVDRRLGTATEEAFRTDEGCSRDVRNLKFSPDGPLLGKAKRFTTQAISTASNGKGNMAEHCCTGVESEEARNECRSYNATESSTSVLKTSGEFTDENSRKIGLFTTGTSASHLDRVKCKTDADDGVGKTWADTAKLRYDSLHGSDFEAEDDSIAQLMYIPQDSRDYVALFTRNAVEERTSAEDVSLKEGFLELPDLDDV